MNIQKHWLLILIAIVAYLAWKKQSAAANVGGGGGVDASLTSNGTILNVDAPVSLNF